MNAFRLAHVRHGLARAATAVRRHWLLVVLLTAGAALRVVTLVAYRPALIFFDSTSYLDGADDLRPGGLRPAGYSAFLRVLPLDAGLWVVPLVQHVLGVVMAVAIYVLLLRFGVRTWLAALATAPVLLDAYQLNLEQYVLSDVLFQALIVCGCVLLLWRRPPDVVLAGLAGVSFAAATSTRSAGLVLIVPAVATVLFQGDRWRRVAALVVCFAVPLLAYAAWFHAVHGVFALNGSGGRLLYARVAPFSDCSKFEVPARERILCPTRPVGERLSETQYVWSRRRSPVYRLDVPEEKRGITPWVARSQVAGAFAKRVIRHQPLDYARVVARDFLRGFAPVRTSGRGDPPVSRWHFRLEHPGLRPEAEALYGARTSRSLAAFLRRYQRFAYVPGPILAAGLVVGLLASIGVGRARRSGLRAASFLFASLAFVLSLGPAAAFLFSWRYQLPQLVLLPPALALGLTAFMARRDDPEAEPPTHDAAAGTDGAGAAHDRPATAPAARRETGGTA